MATEKPLCKYFANGVCSKGERCKNSHDRNVPTNDVCRYYRAGSCSYGRECRYDHIKPKSQLQSNVRTSSNFAGTSGSHRRVEGGNRAPKPIQLDAFLPAETSFNVNAPAFVPSWLKEAPSNYASAAGSVPTPKLRPLCPYFEIGDCPKSEEDCEFVHGILCETCFKACLHPDDPEQQQHHRAECVKQHEMNCEMAFIEQRSSDKRCGVCLEAIYEKNLRFGILEGCTHCFCLKCIRNWRKQQEFETDVIRSCPECRVHSNFVIPSVVWLEEPEEKKVMLDAYKENTAKKICRYYQGSQTGDGDGCPFGNKCWYRHQLPDGSIDPGKEPGSRRLPRLSQFIFANDDDDDADFGDHYEELTRLLRNLLNQGLLNETDFE
ncbi:unnamed protein product, partial [Mesorhabditis belari]|uniref:RING-type E3 ubiquitin transferase n=1 Tax=Mesorhabditis belari TaxID=2138241 RepID=A0AAF3J2I5_9BILA